MKDNGEFQYVVLVQGDPNLAKLGHFRNGKTGLVNAVEGFVFAHASDGLEDVELPGWKLLVGASRRHAVSRRSGRGGRSVNDGGRHLVWIDPLLEKNLVGTRCLGLG